ncbi:unnamed protein product [Eruca vesicaria subsp. sativa]|uniref:Uncharacterized protein n=1 Tax=Eruca vesicaria subsp. sativa TaxID=29727 RepID=A0ABC8JMH3_ERUVS|nr:unnamed protein product [Eruca vesicaria subsp. sativa]
MEKSNSPRVLSGSDSRVSSVVFSPANPSSFLLPPSSFLFPLRISSLGGGLGLMMGLFLGALDYPIMHDTMTGKQQFIFTAKQMGQRSWSSCKTFAVMGLVFYAAECIIEKARAKHDTTNTAFARCVTSGSMSARGGPKAACIGCAGFATFSVLIEKFFDRHT